MHQNMKMSLIASAVIVTLAAGGAYYRVQQLQQKRDYFQDKFTKTQTMLPKSIIIEKTSQSSLFNTDSTYTVQLQNKGQKSPSKLIVHTHLNHGLSYFFTGVIKGTAVGNIVGPFTKEFKSLDKLFDSQIKVLTNDTLITDTKFVDLIAKDGSEFKGITSYLETTKDDDTINTAFKIASMNSPKLANGQYVFSLKGFDLHYSGQSNSIGNNHLAIKLAETQSPMAQIQNISLLADSTVKSGAVNLVSALSIGKINADKWKDGFVDFKYSILGLDEGAIKTMYTIGKQDAPNNEADIEKHIRIMEEQAKILLTRGFEAKVDKLALKAGDDTFNFSFKAVLPKSNSFQEVHVEKNLYAIYNLETKGSFSDSVANFMNMKLQSFSVPTPNSSEPLSLVTVNANELKVKIELSKGKATLNDKSFSADQNDMIHVVLSTIDEKLHSKKNNTTNQPVISTDSSKTTSSNNVK